MFRKMSASLLAVASIAAIGSSVTDANAQPVGKAAAAACVQSYGTRSSGTVTETWTEHFTRNCARQQVRAQVQCRNEFSGKIDNKHGGIINGTGTSSYKCAVYEQLVGGRGQVYSGVKWENLPH